MGSRSRRLQLIVLGTIGMLAIIGVIIVSTGTDADGVTLNPGGNLNDDQEPRITGSMRVDAPINGEEDSRPMDNIADFVREYGEPPNSDYARIRIPSIGVDAPVGLFIVDEGIMPDPQGPVDVAFYDMRHWEGLGGYPGGGGNAIFGGHVDLNRGVPHAGGAHYRGPAVFWHLDRLVPGDVVEVDSGGQALRYAVTWVQELDTVGTNWREIWSEDLGVDSITLFTCGGAFDFTSHEYSHRIVVRAERI